MTVFVVDYTLQDAYGRQTRKRYETEDIVDVDLATEFGSASTAATDLLADLQAITELEVLYFSITHRVIVSDSVTAEANKDEGITLQCRKADNQKAVLKVPGPINSVINADGSVDITATEVVNYVANFEPAGSFTFSDGEKVQTLIKGRLDE